MELHIFPTERGRIIKGADGAIQYIVQSGSHPQQKQIFRAPYSLMSTVSRAGKWDIRYSITLDDFQLSISLPKVFHTKCKFTYKGREYGWKYDKELYDLETGEVLAKHERYPGGCGVLKIKRAGMKMVDVVVATGVTMQYSWDQTRKLKSAVRWRKEGVQVCAPTGIGPSADLGVAIAGGLMRSEVPGQG